MIHISAGLKVINPSADDLLWDFRSFATGFIVL